MNRRLTLSLLMAFWVSLLVVRANAQTVSSDLLRSYERFALSNAGDPDDGERLFSDQRTRCNLCHQVNKKGGEIGPDLTVIGGKFDRPHLIESLLLPSQQIVEGYRTSLVALEDGRFLTGVIKNQTETHIQLFDADAKSYEIDRGSIEEIKTGAKSLMPEDLASALSKQEFTDLIAYLETLRTGKAQFGSGVRGPIQVQPGFAVETLATGLTGATAMEILDDGRILLCEQTGALRVFKNGQLLPEPLLQVETESNWERGLIGVTVHPDFPAQPYVYVCYVAARPFTHHRISRFAVDGDRAITNSEKILLKGDDQSKLGGHVPAGHQGGGMHFGKDGKLYIGIGEQTAGLPAQKLTTLQGKILRINVDGSVPEDNPFLDRTTGKYQTIWATGCRNPFTFAVHPSSGEMLINDVGGEFEEINRGRAGANYGWPTIEHGTRDKPGYESAIHIYPQASISGGDFFPNQATSDTTSKLRGRYFFADFNHGWIKSIDPEDSEQAELFGSGFRRPVDIRFSKDGSLYVLLRNAWVIDGKFQGDTGSLMRVYPTTEMTSATSATEKLDDEIALAKRCRRLLTDSIVDFYLPHCVDQEFGGYHESLDEAGKFSGQEKFLTLQARQLWFFSRLVIEGIEPDLAAKAADSGYQFIDRFFLDPVHGGYFTKVSNDGRNKIDNRKHVYPNAFMIYALVEYHRATGLQKPLEQAMQLFQVLDQHCYDQKNGGYHEFFHADWSPVTGEGHSGYIGELGTKTYNSHLHLLEAFAQLYRETQDPLVKTRLAELIDVCTARVKHPEFPCNIDGWTPEWQLIETDKNIRASFGHDLECAWLVLDAAEAIGNSNSELESWAQSICDFSIQWGHDELHGGFFYTGPVNQKSDDRRKEWWTQSEALVGLLTMEEVSGDAKYRRLFTRTLDFVEEYQIAQEGGWWASLNEDGSSRDSMSRTSMWQGAYHNGRALLRCEAILRGFAD